MRLLYLSRLVLRILRIILVIIAIFIGFKVVIKIADIFLPNINKVPLVEVGFFIMAIASISFLTKKIKAVSTEITNKI